jgi:dTDP-L-rhamnose 4-epimerase
MKALVVGGAGLIGSHVVDLLLARGDEVVILDSLDPLVHRNGAPPWIDSNAELIVGDVRDVDACRRACNGAELVFHQAAFGGFTSDVSHYFDVNCVGTSRLLEVLSRCGEVQRVVVASSQAIYGEGLYACSAHGAFPGRRREIERLEQAEWDLPCPMCGDAMDVEATPETAGWNGSTPYAVSKLATERLVLGWGEAMDVAAVGLRYAMTYGPRQSQFNAYTGVVSLFAGLLLNGSRPIVFEDGHQTRDLVHVSDVAAANIVASESLDLVGKGVNVGNGTSTTVIDMVKSIASGLGVTVDYEVSSQFRPGDNRHVLLDSAELRRTGWCAEVDPSKGLADTAAWLSSQARVDPQYSEVLDELSATGVVRRVRS